MSTLASPEELKHGVPEIGAKPVYVDESKYREMYAFSTSRPEEFWNIMDGESTGSSLTRR